MTPPPIRLTVVLAMLAVCGIFAVADSYSYADQLDVDEMPATPAPAVDEQIKEVADAAEHFNKLRFDSALLKLKEATASHAELPPAEVMMAYWFARANQPGAVRFYLETAVKESPQDPEAFVILGDINLNNQRDRRVTEASLLYARAAVLIDGVQDEDRKGKIAQRIEGGLAAVAASRADWETARTHLSAWLKLDPKSDTAMRQLAVALFQLKLAKESLEQLKAAYEINPKMLHWAATMARFYSQAKDDANAKKWLDYALQVAPQDLSVWLVAARWSLESSGVDPSRLEDAKTQAATAFRIDPNSLQAKILRGVVALFQADYVNAEAYFEAAVSQSPSNFAATNNLALALCEQDDDTRKGKAVEYATNNARMYPKNSEAASTYGWVLYKAGRVIDADKVLRQLAKSGRVSEDTAYFIARVSAEMGRKDDARTVLASALKSTRPFSKRKEAEKLAADLAN